MSFALVRHIHKQSTGHPLLVLYDSGSTTTWIHERALPESVHPTKGPAISGATIAGTFHSRKTVTLDNVVFPEFDKSTAYNTIKTSVIDKHVPCRYDMIIGRDLCRLMGLRLDFEEHVIEAKDVTVAMRTYSELPHHSTHSAPTELFQQWYDEDILAIDKDDSNGYKSKTIKPSSGYTPVNIDNLVSDMNHLSADQRDDVTNLLRQFPKLFDGQLKTYR